jgi:uncharacterized protein with HEPN domain
MKIEAKKRLLDAINACQAIAQFTAGLDFNAYDRDLLLRSAVERQFEIVGEALRQAEEIDPTLIEQIPDIRRIIGLRNRIIHGYDTVDSQIVWDIVQTELPVLSMHLQGFIGRSVT